MKHKNTTQNELKQIITQV